MKRHGGLWDEIVSWPNLLLAARNAQRGKRSRYAVQAFNFRRETQLLSIQRELTSGTYRPGEFRTHRITEPKPRMISAAPYRDRVVHHALMNVLEPILDRRFHPDSYACRKGKGTHAAADRLQGLMRGHAFALQCDVRKFFPSIDHEILKGTFRRVIKDHRTLALMDLIVDSSNEQERVQDWFAGDDLFAPAERRRGLPIGNLTSQWFANWMLNDLDHYVTSGLGIGAYVRYCDDFVLFHDDRCALKDALARVNDRMCMARLRLHEGKVFVRPVRAGLTFVGYRSWPTHRLLRKDTVRRFRRRVRWMRAGYAAGRLEWQDIKPRLASWIGHAQQADTRRLLRRLSREWRFSKTWEAIERVARSDEVGPCFPMRTRPCCARPCHPTRILSVFSRGGAERGPCSSGRLVEQHREQPAVRETQQQHARQSEQQQRIPFVPAFSCDDRREARNRAIHGSRERGLENPGSAPVLPLRLVSIGSRICVVRPRETGRDAPDGLARTPFAPLFTFRAIRRLAS